MRVVEKALGLKKENGLEKRSREKRERDGEVETKDNRPAGQGGSQENIQDIVVLIDSPYN